ncbi:alpha/beta hydrolase [bacterium]|nr:alpha/beta hydrolase [bacterium]
MRWLLLLSSLTAGSLWAQDPLSIASRLRVALPEAIEEKDPSKTVVQFVTNRLLLGAAKGQPAWHTMVPDHKILLRATENPLAGYVVVKHDGTPDVENNASLKPYSIDSFHPMYKVKLGRNEDLLPPTTNEVADTGLSFLKNYWSRDVVILIHGYNNSWETVIRRAAQLKRDLRKKHKRDFAMLVYSWPSLGSGGLMSILEYTDDERRYRQSIPAFATFLEASLLKDGSTAGRGKRWVIAHSMGNRMFLHGLAEMGRRKEAAKEKLPHDLFTRIVLAAPDMEVEDFDVHTKYAFQFCASPKPLMYFHATSNVAVQVSEFEHLDDRAGVKPVVSDKLLTIDAKAAKSPLSEIGHGYYASNDRMVALIADYFFDGADPSKDPQLESLDGGKRWKLK